MINGVAHGPERATTVCQLTMRHFKDGEELVIEPWRAKAFPLIKDLVVDRSAFDRIIEAGGYISVSTGSAPDGNTLLVGKETADKPWTRRPASAAEPAWRPAPMRRPRFSPARKSRTSAFFRRASRSAIAALCAWCADERRRLRQAAPTSANARRCARRRSRSEVIASMNRDYLRASWNKREDIVTAISPVIELTAKR